MNRPTYITDLDHTFLRSDLSVSEFTKNVWNRTAQTAQTGIATARTHKKSMQFLKDLDISMPMILLDGALIATPNREIVALKTVDRPIGEEIVAIGAKEGIYPFVLSLDEQKSSLSELFFYPKKRNALQNELLERYTKDDNLAELSNMPNGIFKIVYMGEKSLLRRILTPLQERFGDTITTIFAPEAYMGCYFLTILHKEADKRHGIETLMKRDLCSSDTLCVFGDNLNDLGMFALASESVAVANAQDAVKKAASHISRYTNDEDAVAHFLQERL